MDPPIAGYLPTPLIGPSLEIVAELPDLTEYLLTLDGVAVAFVGVGVGVGVAVGDVVGDVVGVGELLGVLLQPANTSAAAVPNPAVTTSVRVREIMWVLFSLVYVKRENNASSPIMCDHLSLAAAGPATVAVSLGWCPKPLALASAKRAQCLFARALSEVTVDSTNHESTFGKVIAELLGSPFSATTDDRESAAISLQDSRDDLRLVHRVCTPHVRLDLGFI